MEQHEKFIQQVIFKAAEVLQQYCLKNEINPDEFLKIVLKNKKEEITAIEQFLNSRQKGGFDELNG